MKTRRTALGKAPCKGYQNAKNSLNAKKKNWAYFNLMQILITRRELLYKTPQTPKKINQKTI